LNVNQNKIEERNLSNGQFYVVKNNRLQ